MPLKVMPLSQTVPIILGKNYLKNMIYPKECEEIIPKR